MTEYSVEETVKRNGIQVRNHSRKLKSTVAKTYEQRTKAAIYNTKCHTKYGKLVERENVDTQLTHKWLVEGLLPPQIEGYVMAIQDGTLLSKAAHAATGNPALRQCRLCGKGKDGLTHIISACGKHNFGAYKERHDEVAKVVLNHLLQKYDIEICPAEKAPKAEYNKDQCKVLWDTQLKPVKRIFRPDLVVCDRPAKEIIIIEVTVPYDKRLTQAYEEKTNKYAKLKRDLYRANKSKGYKTVTLLVVTIGALGCVSKQVTAELQGHRLFKDCVPRLMSDVQRATYVGTQMTVKRHLAM